MGSFVYYEDYDDYEKQFNKSMAFYKHKKKIKKQAKEIERLNNIIDELEKYLQNRCNYFDEMQVDYMKDCSKEYEEIDNVLDKLKELKGETNE